jgi:hypothetical protein
MESLAKWWYNWKDEEHFSKRSVKFFEKTKKNFKDTGFLISNVSVVRGQSWFEGCLKISIWSMKCVVATIFECILLLCCCNCMCFLLQTFPFMSINFFHIFVKMKSNTLVQYQLFSLARLIL